MKKIILLILGLLFYSNVFAQVPSTLSYSGKIVDKNGNLLPDGNYSMRFNFYTVPSGGLSVWNEQHLSTLGQGVTVTAGGFDVTFGVINPSLPDFSVPYYLQSEVYINSVWESFGRHEFKSVAYAQMAKGVVDNSITSSKIVDYSITAGDIGTNIINKNHITTTEGLRIVGANIEKETIDQTKASFAPKVFYDGVEQKYPKIACGICTSDSNGNAVILFPPLFFSQPPYVTCTAINGTQNVVCVINPSDIKVDRVGVYTRYSGTGVGYTTNFHWIAVGY